MTRYEKILNGAALWGSFYRYNPDKFVEDYLHLKLRIFQKILIVMMFWGSIFVFVASRGIGKTFLSAIYCVTRCILFPGTKICIASGTRGQALQVLEKILYELKPRSPELQAEINDKDTKINGTNAQVVFHNTSMIKVVTAGDSARGNRCHVLLLDEFRLIKKDTIDTILRKFLTLRRMPEFSELTDEERKAEYDKEKNLTIYLSSAYFKDHWSFVKCRDTLKAMLNPERRQFVCGFPYQLSIREGLLDPEQVADDMAESDFSEVKFLMEMGAEFFGAVEGAFFDYETVSKNRRIKLPMLPFKTASKLNNNPQIKISPKQNGEVRIMSADIALMPSKKHNNDATSIFINQMIPTKAGRWSYNIAYAESCEGMTTDSQALIVRKLFDEYQCDYLVLDCAGEGLGVYDCLIKDMLDPETGEVYPAITCVNDPVMASRCAVAGADKVIWSIKASAQFNSDCAFLLREGFRSGRIRLLINEYESQEILEEIKGYDSLSAADKLSIQMPYINTTLLIDELSKLQHEDAGGKIKIKERSGMRKDRYSSLSYNYYVATQMEIKLNKRQNNSSSSVMDTFIVKPPSYNRKAVSIGFGGNNKNRW